MIQVGSAKSLPLNIWLKVVLSTPLATNATLVWVILIQLCQPGIIPEHTPKYVFPLIKGFSDAKPT